MKSSFRDIPSTQQLKDELKRIKYRKNYFRLLWNTISSLIVVAAIAALVSMFLLPVLRVTGTSMTPTLVSDELVVCTKYSDFECGDIVAFYYNNKILLKRVIAVSGDTVNIDEYGNVYVNSIAIDEPYLSEKALGECDIEFPYQVPDERIFVLGDKRSTSIDSRSSTVGCIAEEYVIGKIALRIWPFEVFGEVR